VRDWRAEIDRSWQILQVKRSKDTITSSKSESEPILSENPGSLLSSNQQSNLKKSLERKFALLAGGLADKQRQVEKIEGLASQLLAPRKRIEGVTHLLYCAEEIVKEIDPA
jgi:hypothetical protein